MSAQAVAAAVAKSITPTTRAIIKPYNGERRKRHDYPKPHRGGELYKRS
jgi:hypothetical protein